MKSWVKYIQWHTFFGGLFTGMVIVGLFMFVIDSHWVERFQGLLSAAGAIVAAMWTISLTVLHRDQDSFKADYRSLASLIAALPGIERHVAKTKLESIPSLPAPVRWDLQMLEYTIRESETFNRRSKRGEVRLLTSDQFQDDDELNDIKFRLQDAIDYIDTWFNDCVAVGRYLEYRPLVSILGCADDFYRWIWKQPEFDGS